MWLQLDSGLPGNDKVTPCRSHVFLRGHTDRVTHLKMSTAGHILASAQGDALGGAGEIFLSAVWLRVERGVF